MKKLKELDTIQYLIVVLITYLFTFVLLGSLGVRSYLIETYSKFVEFIVFLVIYVVVFIGFAYFIDWLWKTLKIEKKK